VLQLVERAAEFARKIECAEVHGLLFGGPESVGKPVRSNNSSSAAELTNRLVAAVAGALKDAAQEEILNDARFERLEADGRAQFAGQIAELRHLLR